MMKWSWIDFHFPWVGFAAALAVLVLLFSTDRLRRDLARPRWRDLTWLSWLAVVIYLIHNVEEYGLDLLGRPHAFPSYLCATLGQLSYPMCPIPPAFYLAVNLPLFWVGAPIAALVSRRHPVVGLSFYGVIFVNGLAHIAGFVRTGYNPGALSAAVLFLPISFWVTLVSFGKHGLPYQVLALIVADSIILHLVLLGSAILFLRGAIGSSTLTVVQILNAVLFCVLAWLCESWAAGIFVNSEGVVTPIHQPS